MSHDAWHRASRFQRCLGVLAILTLAARSLVPAGYMVAAAEGRAQLVICPAGLHLHQAGHAHHGMDYAASGARGGMGHGGERCPFALSSGAGLSGTAPAAGVPYLVHLGYPPAVAFVGVATPPPLRHQAPRGPPSLV